MNVSLTVWLKDTSFSFVFRLKSKTEPLASAIWRKSALMENARCVEHTFIILLVPITSQRRVSVGALHQTQILKGKRQSNVHFCGVILYSRIYLQNAKKVDALARSHLKHERKDGPEFSHPEMYLEGNSVSLFMKYFFSSFTVLKFHEQIFVVPLNIKANRQKSKSSVRVQHMGPQGI